MGKPSNPYAFPGETYEANGHVTYQEGMTLRDWFAGQALAGWMASYDAQSDHPCQRDENPEQHGQIAANLARWSYRLADAMLTERTPK